MLLFWLVAVRQCSVHWCNPPKVRDQCRFADVWPSSSISTTSGSDLQTLRLQTSRLVFTAAILSFMYVKPPFFNMTFRFFRILSNSKATGGIWGIEKSGAEDTLPRLWYQRFCLCRWLLCALDSVGWRVFYTEIEPDHWSHVKMKGWRTNQQTMWYQCLASTDVPVTMDCSNFWKIVKTPH